MCQPPSFLVCMAYAFARSLLIRAYVLNGRILSDNAIWIPVRLTVNSIARMHIKEFFHPKITTDSPVILTVNNIARIRRRIFLSKIINKRERKSLLMKYNETKAKIVLFQQKVITGIVVEVQLRVLQYLIPVTYGKNSEIKFASFSR